MIGRERGISHPSASNVFQFKAIDLNCPKVLVAPEQAPLACQEPAVCTPDFSSASRSLFSSKHNLFGCFCFFFFKFFSFFKKSTTMLYSIRINMLSNIYTPNIRSQSLVYVEVRMINYHMLCISELVSPFPQGMLPEINIFPKVKCIFSEMHFIMTMHLFTHTNKKTQTVLHQLSVCGFRTSG